MDTAPPEISGITKGRTMKSLPDVGTYKEAPNRFFFDITGLVCKLQTEIPIFENATSKHANFTKFCGLSILTSEINPANFRSISRRLAILLNNL